MSIKKRTIQIMMVWSLPLLIIACNSDSELETPQVNIIEIAQLPTLITPVTDTPLPPTFTPTATLTATPSPTVTQSPTATATPTITPIPLIQLVIAVQPIPSGMPIPPGALRLVDWPMPYAPVNRFTSLNAVINQVALVDIGCYEPLLPQAVAPREIGTVLEPLPVRCPPFDLSGDLPLIEVVIARKDIAAGQRIDPDDIAVLRWPGAVIPPGAYHNMSDVLGDIAQKTILRQQPITSERVAPGG